MCLQKNKFIKHFFNQDSNTLNEILKFMAWILDK